MVILVAVQIIPTGKYTPRSDGSFNSVCAVLIDGIVLAYGVIESSYGHLTRYAIPKFTKIFVVKIAEHGLFRHCVVREVGW